MMRTIFIYLLLLFSVYNYSQQVAVKILEQNEKTHYTFKGYNTLSEPVEITFQLLDVEGLEYNGQKVILIQPKDTVEIMRLKKIGKSIGFLMDYQQVMIPNEPNKLYNPTEYEKYNQGIVVFSRDGCTRCNYATNYLIKKNVDFTLLNFTQNPAHGQYMWDKLKEQGVTSKQVRTPIIMVDGVLSHSHENLSQFVKKLSKR
ncbi:MAG: glutaredoxin domain-containing protein [Bacteroidota bacterium]